MLHNGPNEVDGIPVEVIRKRIRRYNLRVDSDGTVKLSVPKWWGTLRQAECFLREKWAWVHKTRAEVLARPAATRTPVTETEVGSPADAPRRTERNVGGSCARGRGLVEDSQGEVALGVLPLA